MAGTGSARGRSAGNKAGKQMHPSERQKARNTPKKGAHSRDHDGESSSGNPRATKAAKTVDASGADFIAATRAACGMHGPAAGAVGARTDTVPALDRPSGATTRPSAPSTDLQPMAPDAQGADATPGDCADAPGSSAPSEVAQTVMSNVSNRAGSAAGTAASAAQRADGSGCTSSSGVRKIGHCTTRSPQASISSGVHHE